jgi:hypothetical protein
MKTLSDVSTRIKVSLGDVVEWSYNVKNVIVERVH